MVSEHLVYIVVYYCLDSRLSPSFPFLFQSLVDRGGVAHGQRVVGGGRGEVCVYILGKLAIP